MFVMKDGKVRPPQLSDLKEVAKRDRRIRQLEKQCEVLAAEVDAMRPVVEAAVAWYDGAANWSAVLAKTCATYEAKNSK